MDLAWRFAQHAAGATRAGPAAEGQRLQQARRTPACAHQLGAILNTGLQNDPSAPLGAIRMADVARAAGVARVTVSRVLSHPHHVSPATRAAVMAAIARLGYLPNLNAGTLARSSSRMVGVIVSDLTRPWIAEALSELCDLLGREGYQLLIGQSHDAADREHLLVEGFLGRRVDALALIGLTGSKASLARPYVAGIPVVETWPSNDGTGKVEAGFSNFSQGYSAAVFLQSRACHVLAFAGPGDFCERRRLEGFQCAIEKYGSASLRFSEAGTNVRDLCQADGIFCSDADIAHAIASHHERLGQTAPLMIVLSGAGRFATALCPVALADNPGAKAARLLLARLSLPTEPSGGLLYENHAFDVVGRTTSAATRSRTDLSQG